MWFFSSGVTPQTAASHGKSEVNSSNTNDAYHDSTPTVRATASTPARVPLAEVNASAKLCELDAYIEKDFADIRIAY